MGHAKISRKVSAGTAGMWRVGHPPREIGNPGKGIGVIENGVGLIHDFRVGLCRWVINDENMVIGKRQNNAKSNEKCRMERLVNIVCSSTQ